MGWSLTIRKTFPFLLVCLSTSIIIVNISRTSVVDRDGESICLTGKECRTDKSYSVFPKFQTAAFGCNLCNLSLIRKSHWSVNSLSHNRNSFWLNRTFTDYNISESAFQTCPVVSYSATAFARVGVFVSFTLSYLFSVFVGVTSQK